MANLIEVDFKQWSDNPILNEIIRTENLHVSLLLAQENLIRLLEQLRLLVQEQNQ